MRRQLRRILLGATLCALGLVTAGAQAQEPTLEELAKEIQALREGQQQMAKEIAEIKRLVQTRPAAAAPSRPAGPDVEGKTFDIGSNPAKGERTAKLTLVEFADYQ